MMEGSGDVSGPSGSGGAGSLDGVMDSFQNAVDSAETEMTNAATASQDGSSRSIMMLQLASQKWMIMHEMESNLEKVVSETLRDMSRNIS